MIQLAIITGASGAGKTYALSTFEENGYFVIDNIPLTLMDKLFNEFVHDQDKYAKVALSVHLSDAQGVFDLSKKYKQFAVIFLGLGCSKEVLLERFKLNRRVHPYQTSGMSLNDAIDLDLKNILALREEFTHFVDTSKLTTGQLRKYLYANIFANEENKLCVNFISFAYKKSVPQDVEMVFDARILPNPYWVSELKDLCGLDEPVKKYIFDSPVATEYLNRVISFLDYYLNFADEKGRKIISIGIACSGGQHRSVAVSEYLKNYYAKKYNTSVSHRDLIK